MAIQSWFKNKSGKTADLMPSGFQQPEWRIQLIERDVGLAVKAVVILILFYYLYLSHWLAPPPIPKIGDTDASARRFAQDLVQLGFLPYAALNIGMFFILKGMQQLPMVVVQWTVFSSALIDGLFLGAMILITGGVDSALYWLYLLLIIRNASTFVAPVPQIMLNLLMPLFYAGAIMMDAWVQELDHETGPDLGSPFLLRLLLLIAASAWCYGLAALLDRQLQGLEELRELAVRREQLQSSGRLAAEIAHQLKNPLGIINNAAFTLQRNVKEGKSTITQQIQIIREEIERSDRIITELMGYAQLMEGRVEKLDVKEELDRAILQVLPPAVKYQVTVHRDYEAALPELLAQRNHLSEVFVNILQNAREAMGGAGNIWVTARHGENYSVTITIADDGPGIAPHHLNRIFEPYFSTREKGTGLGLAIVKHNLEIYGGRVTVESELGKGSRFHIEFPARTLMKLRK